MKIIALCSVDENVLRSTLDLGEKDIIDVNTVTSEFGWMNDTNRTLICKRKVYKAYGDWEKC